jgi:hypothetical protein
MEWFVSQHSTPPILHHSSGFKTSSLFFRLFAWIALGHFLKETFLLQLLQEA